MRCFELQQSVPMSGSTSLLAMGVRVGCAVETCKLLWRVSPSSSRPLHASSPMLVLLATPLFDWGRQNGVWISDGLTIQPTPYGGNGLYAATDISAGTELIRVPGHLQLGIPQLAEGDDAELQRFARCLPPVEMRFLPCAVALCAEARKGCSSIFHGYIRELPTAYSNAIAPVHGFSDDVRDASADEPADLAVWEPALAGRVGRMRSALRALHQSAAPDSLAFRDLCWASASVCSRSFTRRPHRLRSLTEEESARVGKYAAADRTRLLPVIDIVNHAVPSSTANADVRHLKQDEDDNPRQPSEREYDPLSTSLVVTHDIHAGREILLDYGAGPGGMSHERALVDFGFVLPLHSPEYTGELPLELLVSAVPPAVFTEEARYLRIYVTGMRRIVEPGALRFDATGEPSVPTLAFALAHSFRGSEELARIVQAVDSDEAEEMAEERLLAHIVECSTASQTDHARNVLATAAASALAQIQSAIEGKGAAPGEDERSHVQEADADAVASFDGVARMYREVTCEMLKLVVERCTHRR